MKVKGLGISHSCSDEVRADHKYDETRFLTGCSSEQINLVLRRVCGSHRPE
jgi:hypothetical protein